MRQTDDIVTDSQADTRPAHNKHTLHYKALVLHWLQSPPEVALSVGIIHALGDVLLVLAICEAVHTALTDGHSCACILAARQDEVGSNIGIFEECHGDEFVILSGFRIL